MNELNDLAAVARTYNGGSSRRAAPAQGNPAASGFLFALGAAPVILLVVVLANWVNLEVNIWRGKQEVNQAVQEVNRQLDDAMRGLPPRGR